MDTDPRPAPVMDVVTAPPPDKSDDGPADRPADKPAHEPPPEPPKGLARPPGPEQPKTPSVGLAIFATVVIVLALAALATYAYLKSH